jgi:molecular chaperone DnaK
VERMQKDAEMHAEEDKKKKELVDAKNQADTLIFSLEKTMRENDAKIPDATKKSVNEKMNALRDVLKKDGVTTEELKKSTEELAVASQEIGKMVYEQAQKEQQAAGATGEKKDDVVDAEVVDEKKEA